jgi:hypothetical protein
MIVERTAHQVAPPTAHDERSRVLAPAFRLVIRGVLAASAACAACAAPASSGFEAESVDTLLANTVRRGAGARAVLDSVGPTGWEFFYVFGPYTTVDAMRRCITESHGFETYGVDRREDIDVLVFRTPKGELFSMQMPRASASFSEDALARRYPRAGARFIVRRNASGALELAPADTSVPRCS